MADYGLRNCVFLLIMIFPVSANLATHAGSVILALLTLPGLPLLLKKKRPQITKEEKWVLAAFVAYFVVYFLSFLLNSLWGTLEDPQIKYLDHEVRWLSIIPIFLLLRRSQISQGVLWYSVIIGAVISGLYAIASRIWLFPGARVFGSYHSIAFGDLSIVLAFMSLLALRFFLQKHAAYLIFPTMAFLLGITASILSETRGAWIAVPAFLTILFFYWGRSHIPKMRIVMAVAIILVFLGAYKMPGSIISERMQLMFKEAVTYYHGNVAQNATSERLEGWLAAWEIYRDNPVFGAGPGNFQPTVQKMIAERKRSKIISTYHQPHSTYLEVMADCGTLGLAVLLGVFVIPLWAVSSAIKLGGAGADVGYAGLMFIVGFVHFGLTETIFGQNVFVSSYIVMLATVLAITAGFRDSRLYR